MFTEFLCKRFICFMSFVVAGICLSYAFLLSKTERVDFYENVYYLVGADMRVEASAEFMKWDGGAGYLLKADGEEYAAISVFCNETSAKTVQNRLSAIGQRVSIVRLGKNTLYFKGKEKDSAGVYISALKLFKSYMLLFEDCILKVENGMSQEGCKRILTTLEKQLAHARIKFRSYKAYVKACEKFEEGIKELCADTIYLRDMRYLLCWQAEKYIELCNAFSL